MPDYSNQVKRLERAKEQSVQLDSLTQGWIDTTPINGFAKIANDRLSWKLILRVKTEPNLAEWGLLFGESIHNLRSLLNNLVVVIAKDNGVSDPKKLKSLQFPICGSEEEWSKQKKRISSLPLKYQETIKDIQPLQRFKEGLTPEQDCLLILRNLSNEDKHQIQIKPKLETLDMFHGNSVEFESTEAATKNCPPNVEILTPTFKNGATLLIQKTSTRIVKVKGSFKFSSEIQVIVPNIGAFGLTKILKAVCYYTEEILNYIISK
jgi:hypothetical protein